jgi:hypothetical protein
MKSLSPLFALSLAFGCSAGGADGSTDGPSSTGSGASNGGGHDDSMQIIIGNGGSDGSGNGGAGWDPGGGGTSGSCLSEVRRGEQVPLDIYIMFDVSCSMGCSQWKTGPGQCCDDSDARIIGVRAALEAFLNDPASTGIGVGLGYFGHHPLGTTSCNPADYTTPSVAIAPLPGNAQPLIDSLNAQAPTGETPTGAAIRGACTVAQGRRQAYPANMVVTLLVTDGVPEAPVSFTCNPTIEDAATAAQECNSGPSAVPTFVLGVGGNLDLLQQIATAGGTEQAYLVDGSDVASDVLAALNAIRGLAQIPCEFRLPEAPSGSRLDLDSVNVVFNHDANSPPQTIFYVEGASECRADTGGWYFNDSANPDRILLCDSTCNVVETTTAGQVDLQLGCERIHAPPR